MRLAAIEKRDWAAKWIWDHGAANPKNYFLMVRRNFQLDGKPAAAVLHITSAHRYTLFVNGIYAGRGPARSDPRWKAYDTYDVSRYLIAGRNTIAALAYHYGPGIGPYRGTN